MGMLLGDVKGFFVVGENPAVGSPNSSLHRRAMANLDWLVVRDFFEIESAAFWYDSPEIETGELRTEDIKTEIFFLPAADHLQKQGSFTNTQRLLQWHHQAVEPEGDCRSELWFYYHLGKRIREKLRDSTEPRDGALRDLTWDYPTLGEIEEPDAHAVLREINGWGPDGNCARRVHEAQGRRLDRVRLLDLLRRVRGRAEPCRAPQAGRGAELGRARMGLGVAGEPPHALQPRVGRPRRASRGASARSTSGGMRSKREWTGDDVPDFIADKAAGLRAARRRARRTTRSTATVAVHHASRRQGLAVRAGRARRRAVSDALRAARNRRSPTRSTRSSESRARDGGRARTIRIIPRRANRVRRCFRT